MRITVVNWSNRKVGGVESYLSAIIPALVGGGHEVSFWHETSAPENRDPVLPPGEILSWSVAELGVSRALASLREWQPDLIFSHGLHNPELEAQTVSIAPAVFFVHSYYGACISGTKTFQQPVVTPCRRSFGPMCLVHYYPHRCGGLNPVTMLREYARQSQRLKILSDYRAVVTHSSHMREVYLQQGLAPERLHYLPCFVTDGVAAPTLDARPQPTADVKDTPWRLLFLGRMEFLKGGLTFLSALPEVTATLERPLDITFAGDGPERAAWQTEAERIQLRHSRIKVNFTGWMSHHQLDSLFDNADLIVVPSLHPEPLGLVGVEAGLRGVPAVAFRVGGIPDWLADGVNGYLASDAPPAAAGLAKAIVNCLRDSPTHTRLRQGAYEQARRLTLQNHLHALLEVFEQAVTLEKLTVD